MCKGLSNSLLAITCVAAFSAPALAGNSNSMVDTKQLPPTTFHKSPIRAQIINESPIITNCVRPEQKPMGIRIIGTGQVEPTQIDANDGGGLDGMQVGTPGVSRSNPMVNTAGIQPSTFSSNLSPGGPGIPGGRALQPGLTTNRLLGVTGRLKTAPRTQPVSSGSAPQTMAIPTPTTASIYQPYLTGNGSSASGTRIKTSVNGTLRSHHLAKTSH